MSDPVCETQEQREGAAFVREVVQRCKDNVAASPCDARFHYRLASVYYHTREYDKAVLEYEEVLKLCPDWRDPYCCLSATLCLLRRNEEAKAVALQALKRWPNDIHLLHNLATAHMELREYEKAVRTLWHLIKHYPANASAYNTLGIVYKELGLLVEAADAHKQAIELEPRMDIAYFNLALVHHKSGDHSSAISMMEQFIAMRPDEVDAYEKLAVMFYSAGKLNEALNHLATVLRLEPRHVKVHYWLGLIYLQLGHGDVTLREYRILAASDDALAEKLMKQISKGRSTPLPVITDDN